MNKETNQAMNLALRLLTARRRTRRELEVHLGRKGFSSEVISPVLEKLEYYGYLDDKTFARLWVEQRLAKRGLVKLKNELKAKGVEPELISEIIAEVEPEAEYNAAMALVLKKLQKAAGPYPLPRMAGFLQRRGFSYETISRVCRTLKDSGILSDSTDYYY
ncbi:MAG TPA: regulatory protein RecX [Bacillota bacterium]|nr:regulatory protein RecX [Peptococcaceae bacterium MAG4]NLW39146.1 RecX family transcriptional regulator [Peptococcaceae bacterium]HPZ42436.1 regulatory protein RecX [Bacillota bacterium]HQD75102.1 regulatory protein RecX [Bacillota bacterium]HUM57659.1 regulatory protein RecX [Bacillota bacterium]